MSIIIGVDTNPYFTSQSELQVNDGDTALADDVNGLTQKTNTAFDRVKTDIDTYLTLTEGYKDSASAYAVSASGFMASASYYADAAFSQSNSAGNFMDQASGYADDAYAWALSAATAVSGNVLSGVSGITVDSVVSGVVLIHHNDTSSQASLNLSGSSFIQDLSFDTYGHVTGTTSGSLSFSGTSGVTVSAGASGNSFLFYHNDTSSQTAISGSGPRFIQSLAFDPYGHVTGAASGTVYVLSTPSATFALTTPGTSGEELIFTTPNQTNARLLFIQNEVECGQLYTTSAGAIITSASSYTHSTTTSGGVVVQHYSFRPDTSGTINCGGSTFPWMNIYTKNPVTVTSDENTKSISAIGDVSWLYEVEPITFRWIGDTSYRSVHYGFGAQSVDKVVPGDDKFIVKQGDEEKPWGMCYTEMIAPMLKLIQEQKIMIDDLTARVNALEGGN